MSSALLLVFTLATVDPCIWQEQETTIKMDGDQRLRFTRHYSRTWYECLSPKVRNPPRLLVTARQGNTRRVLLDETVKLQGGLSPGSRSTVSKNISKLCPAPNNQRQKNDVLWGPEGRKRWHTPVDVEIELSAEGVLRPLSYSTRVQVMCPVCKGDETASSSFYRVTSGPAKDRARQYVHIPIERFACARGGGDLHLRYYWKDDKQDVWLPTHPFKVDANIEKKMRQEGDKMVWEVQHPTASLCRPGKQLVWELVGLDEFAYIANRRSLGPSRHIRRSTVEFLRCPQ